MAIVDGNNFESKRNVRKGCQKKLFCFPNHSTCSVLFNQNYFFRGGKSVQKGLFMIISCKTCQSNHSRAAHTARVQSSVTMPSYYANNVRFLMGGIGIFLHSFLEMFYFPFFVCHSQTIIIIIYLWWCWREQVSVSITLRDG